MKRNKTLKLLIQDLAKLGYHVQHHKLPSSGGKSRVTLNKGSDHNPYGYYYDLPKHLTGNDTVVAQFLMLMYFKVVQDIALGKEIIGQVEPIVVKEVADG